MSEKVPCKFFQQGSCRNGKRCQYPHVKNDSSSGGWSNSSNTYSKNRNSFQADLERFWAADNRKLKETEIKNALSGAQDIEIQPLTSSFGLAHPAVNNLIDGRDYSFEESRLDYYLAKQNNTIADYERQIDIRQKDMKDCLEYVHQNIEKAARYAQLATKSFHENGSIGMKPFMPKELDVGVTVSNNAFGNSSFGSTSASKPFGSSTTVSAPFGGQASSFGKSEPGAFGSSSLSTGSAFGNPTSSTSAFGSTSFKSSTLSNPFAATKSSDSPFGKLGLGSSSTPSPSNSAFGQSTLGAKPLSSGFGSTGFGTTSFGNTATKTNSGFGSSGFGTSGFGTTGSGKSAFGADSSSTAASGFGSFGLSSDTSQKSFATVSNELSGFGKTGFGKTALSTASSFGNFDSPFGALGSKSATSSSSPFGQSSDSSSPFSKLTSDATKPALSQPTNELTKPSPFSQSSNTTSAFSTNLTSSASSKPSSTFSAFGQTATTSSPFGGLSSNSSTTPFGESQQSNAFGASQSGPSAFGSSSFNSGTNPFGSSSFGFGAQSSGPFKSELQQCAKDEPRITPDELSDALKDLFKAEKFSLGKVPEAPPPLEYC